MSYPIEPWMKEAIYEKFIDDADKARDRLKERRMEKAVANAPGKSKPRTWLKVRKALQK